MEEEKQLMELKNKIDLQRINISSGKQDLPKCLVGKKEPWFY
jgi:hypothetical protein